MAQSPALRRGFFAGRGCFSLPNRTRCAGLRFGFGCRHERLCIYTVSMLHVVADGISFATTFYYKSLLTHSVAAPFQIANTSLVCDLVYCVYLKLSSSSISWFFDPELLLNNPRLLHGGLEAGSISQSADGAGLSKANFFMYDKYSFST